MLLQAIRSGFVKVPLTAQTVQLEDMPKRGRPAKVSKALQIDSPTRKRKASFSANSIKRGKL